jgi:hypothetical protein
MPPLSLHLHGEVLNQLSTEGKFILPYIPITTITQQCFIAYYMADWTLHKVDLKKKKIFK